MAGTKLSKKAALSFVVVIQSPNILTLSTPLCAKKAKRSSTAAALGGVPRPQLHSRVVESRPLS